MSVELGMSYEIQGLRRLLLPATSQSVGKDSDNMYDSDIPKV